MSWRILFVLATGVLFASLSWSDNDARAVSSSAVFNPQTASVPAPGADPLNDDCSRAIPLEDGVKVWGTHAGYGEFWYSFTPQFNGTLRVTTECADPNIFIESVFVESCQDDSYSDYVGGSDGTFVFYQEVKQDQPYYIGITLNSPNLKTYSIQADLILPSAPGDICIEAIELEPNSSIQCSTVGATGFSSYCSPCESSRDVWFKFAPSVEGCVRIFVTVEDENGLCLNLFDSCGGYNLDWGGGFYGNQTILRFLDVTRNSDYRIRIIQDAASTVPFVLETRIVPTVSVFGRVVDKTTGEGISGVPLTLGGTEYNGQIEWSVTTDLDGYFALEHNLPEGIYSVRSGWTQWFEDYQFGDLDGTVTLTAGMGSLVLEMVRGSNLEVLCVDADTGETITEGMRISGCIPSEGDDQYDCLDLYYSLPPGWIKVVASPKDLNSGYTSREEWVYLKAGENRMCIIPMKKGIPIQGTVRDAYGNLHPGSWIRLYGENGIFGIYSQNDVLPAWLPPGVYGCWTLSWDCGPYQSSPWQRITVSEDPGQNQNPDLTLYGNSEGSNSFEWNLQHPDSLDHAGPFDVLAVPPGIVPAPENILTFEDHWLNPWGDHWVCIGSGGLGAARYDLYFGILSHPQPDFSFTALGPKLDVPAGAEEVQVSYTSEGSTMMGKVLDTEGFPLLLPEILLNKMPCGEFAGWAKTNPRGQFVFYNVPAGTYTLSAVHRNYTMQQTTVTVPESSSVVMAATLMMQPKGQRQGADFSGDGRVNIDDLSNLTADWMQAGSQPADLDQSGIVDLSDLARMSQTWLGQAVWLNRPAQFPEYPSGLIGLWTLDEQVDLKTVLDWSGTGRHGRAQQNLSARVQEGMVDLALRFDGTGDYIDCGPLDPQQPAAWTVCAWVKCSDTPTPTLISFGSSHPAVKLQQNDKGRPIIYLGQYNFRYFSASAWTTLQDGLWHHVAFSVPGSDPDAINRAAMYLDGEPVADITTRATGPQEDKSHLYLGINSKTGQQRFKGAMDEVLLFDWVLSAEEIERIYRSSR